MGTFNLQTPLHHRVSDLDSLNTFVQPQMPHEATSPRLHNTSDKSSHPQLLGLGRLALSIVDRLSIFKSMSTHSIMKNLPVDPTTE